MINPRYQNGHVFLVAFSTAFFLYLVGSLLEKWGNAYSFAAAVIAVFTTGYLLFRKRVARYF
jgi:lipopolysaccharide export LptBFGC system permease protein LptF